MKRNHLSSCLFTLFHKITIVFYILQYFTIILKKTSPLDTNFHSILLQHFPSNFDKSYSPKNLRVAQIQPRNPFFPLRNLKTINPFPPPAAVSRFQFPSFAEPCASLQQIKTHPLLSTIQPPNPRSRNSGNQIFGEPPCSRLNTVHLRSHQNFYLSLFLCTSNFSLAQTSHTHTHRHTASALSTVNINFPINYPGILNHPFSHNVSSPSPPPSSTPSSL